MFQVFGCGAAIEQWIEPWKWWRWPSADHWRGCDWASERRKELQKHAPDRETAGDMLPLSASPAGTYLSLASLPPFGEGEGQPLFLAIRINRIMGKHAANSTRWSSRGLLVQRL